MIGGVRVAAVAAVAVFALVPQARAAALERVGLADAPAASSAAVRAGQLAERHKGKPYAWGADGPARYDCSGLVIHGAWRPAGADWPDTTADGLWQHWRGHRVQLGKVRPGDLLFWRGAAGMTHVAIVTTRGRYVEAAGPPGSPVRIGRLPAPGATAAARPAVRW